MKEVWKDIDGWDGWYQVSSFGQVRSVDRIGHHKLYGSMVLKGKMLKQGIVSWRKKDKSDGYLQVLLSKNERRENNRVNQLVANAFIQNPHNKPFVNHKDGNKRNNEVSNLEWCTNAENMEHAAINGLMPKGSQKSNKLTDANVLEIKKLLKEGHPQSKISRKFNVVQGTISSINRSNTWKHIQ